MALLGPKPQKPKKKLELTPTQSFFAGIDKDFSNFLSKDNKDDTFVKGVELFATYNREKLRNNQKELKDIFQKMADKKGDTGIFGRISKPIVDKITQILNPGETFIEPLLKKKGVSSELAFGIGLGLDILVPGPGEVARIKKAKGLLPSLKGVKNLFKRTKALSIKKENKIDGIEFDASRKAPESQDFFGGEAPRKFQPLDTAEDFIKNIPTDKVTKTSEPVLLRSFHGTDKQFDKFEVQPTGVRYSGDGIYFTPSKEGAKSFSGENGRVIESFLDLKKPFVAYLPEDNIDFQFGNDFIREIKSRGHDALIVRIQDIDTITKKVEADFVNEIVVFDTNSIKTKSQIADMFNKSNPIFK